MSDCAAEVVGVWDLGMALREETLIDHQFGRIMNANIAEYHVTVSADARANILGAKAKASDEVFNIASGTETSLFQLAEALASAMGKRHLQPTFAPERSSNPVPRRLASTSKAERLLGFSASIPLDQGLRELVRWWRGERGSFGSEQEEAIVP